MTSNFTAGDIESLSKCGSYHVRIFDDECSGGREFNDVGLIGKTCSLVQLKISKTFVWKTSGDHPSGHNTLKLTPSLFGYQLQNIANGENLDVNDSSEIGGRNLHSQKEVYFCKKNLSFISHQKTEITFLATQYIKFVEQKAIENFDYIFCVNKRVASSVNQLRRIRF